MPPVELQVLLSALILPYKIKKKLSKEIQLHERNTQPLLTDEAITRVKGQTCVKLLSKKLLGSFSLIQREVGICSTYVLYALAYSLFTFLKCRLPSWASCMGRYWELPEIHTLCRGTQYVHTLCPSL